MNEFEFIHKLQLIKKRQKIPLGIGDDCAVLDDGFVLCSDSLVEGIHFNLNYFTLYDIVRKSILVNLSDILSMNASPLYYLLNIALPKNKTHKLDSIIKAIEDINKEFNIDLIGGDTSSSVKDIFVSVSMMGKGNKLVFRNGAKNNDSIFIAGVSGKSSLALKFLLENKTSCYDSYHISPKINFLFLELFKQVKPNSMIDISDGLLNDLNHILESSSKGALINEDIFLDHDIDFFNYCNAFNLNPFDFIYNGGEDFILLFTSDKPQKMLENARKLNLEILEIGKITTEVGIFNYKGNKLNTDGYLHF